MQLLIVLFIIVPIIEITVLLQVGGWIGVVPTVAFIIITAVIGVNLLKRQGFNVWADIQKKMAQGQIPALEMASAAQLIFAGALLVTPGFVTDLIGFLLLLPTIRNLVAYRLIGRWSSKINQPSKNNEYHYRTSYQATFQEHDKTQDQNTHHQSNAQMQSRKSKTRSRIIDGEYEDETKES